MCYLSQLQTSAAKLSVTDGEGLKLRNRIWNWHPGPTVTTLRAPLALHTAAAVQLTVAYRAGGAIEKRVWAPIDLPHDLQRHASLSVKEAKSTPKLMSTTVRMSR